MSLSQLDPLGNDCLPTGVRSRFVENVNGLRMHILEAGYDARQPRPCMLLLHGFPELAYSWRKIMLPLAEAGYYVVAPDQRGYGRTLQAPIAYDDDLSPFHILNLITDIVWLIAALGRTTVSCIIGHDYGSSVAASCALARPDIFQSVVMMSTPFSPPFSRQAEALDSSPILSPSQEAIHRDLAQLTRPRKHYHLYYASRDANQDMTIPSQGLHAFLRAYYHHKSADWRGNNPFQLQSWTAQELSKLPTYYIMDLNQTMAETCAAEMPTAAEISSCTWLTDTDLDVYVQEYRRTGFQGGLQWYRTRMDGSLRSGLSLFGRRTIDVPSIFIAGRQDWGSYQVPHGIEKMQSESCTKMKACHFIDGAGHWVQQEKPGQVVQHILRFKSEC